jgi:hypothetical protein
VDEDGICFDAGVRTVHLRRGLATVAVPTLISGSADDNRFLLRVDTRSLASLAVQDGTTKPTRGAPKALVQAHGQRRNQTVTWEDALVTMRVGDRILVTYQDGETQSITGLVDGPHVEA